MSVGLKVDVESSAMGSSVSLLEGKNFRVLYAFVGVRSSADNVALRVGDDRADVRIGRGETDTLTREFKRLMQELFVSGVGVHSGRVYLMRIFSALSSRAALFAAKDLCVPRLHSCCWRVHRSLQLHLRAGSSLGSG